MKTFNEFLGEMSKDRLRSYIRKASRRISKDRAEGLKRARKQLDRYINQNLDKKGSESVK